MSSVPRNDCESMRPALLQRAEAASSDGPFGTLASGAAGARADAEQRVDRASIARDDLDVHLAGCAACRRELARATRRTELVRSLVRVGAPSELDGAVVAALQAGMRQERAIEAVAALTPVAAPEELARRIAVPRAPAVLERLVAEDLADPAKAVASRYARRLERLRAPDDLAQRLVRSPRRPASRFLPIALATAGLLLTVGALTLAYILRGKARELPATQGGVVLVVERVDSVQQLDPVAAQLLAGFTGGLVDAERLKREEM